MGFTSSQREPYRWGSEANADSFVINVEGITLPAALPFFAGGLGLIVWLVGEKSEKGCARTRCGLIKSNLQEETA